MRRPVVKRDNGKTPVTLTAEVSVRGDSEALVPRSLRRLRLP
jgi:hypothetical protein